MYSRNKTRSISYLIETELIEFISLKWTFLMYNHLNFMFSRKTSKRIPFSLFTGQWVGVAMLLIFIPKGCIFNILSGPSTYFIKVQKYLPLIKVMLNAPFDWSWHPAFKAIKRRLQYMIYIAFKLFDSGPAKFQLPTTHHPVVKSFCNSSVIVWSPCAAYNFLTISQLKLM